MARGLRVCILFEGRDGAGEVVTFDLSCSRSAQGEDAAPEGAHRRRAEDLEAVAHAEDEKRVRLNILSDILGHVPYKRLKRGRIKLPPRKIGRYNAAESPVRLVPCRF